MDWYWKVRQNIRDLVTQSANVRHDLRVSDSMSFICKPYLEALGFRRTPNHLPAIGSSEPSEDSSGLTKWHQMHQALCLKNCKKLCQKHCKTVQFRLFEKLLKLSSHLAPSFRSRTVRWEGTRSAEVTSLRSLAVSSGLTAACSRLWLYNMLSNMLSLLFCWAANGQTPSIWRPLINSWVGNNTQESVLACERPRFGTRTQGKWQLRKGRKRDVEPALSVSHSLLSSWDGHGRAWHSCVWWWHLIDIWIWSYLNWWLSFHILTSL